MKRFINVRIAQSLTRATRLAVAIGSAGLLMAACKDTNDPGVLTTLAVAPNPATVAAGATVQMTASGTDFTGAKVVPNAGAIVWSVAAGGGTINASTGVFTAGTKAGTYTNTVVATCRGITASATVVVTAGPLATITVTPNPTLAIGTQQQFTAAGADAFGNVVAITPVWTATSPPGTIVATSGLFTAGNTIGVFANSVTATAGGKSGSATVTVIAGPAATITVTPNPSNLVIGTQQQFTAVAMDAGGNVVPITPVWTVVAGGGAIAAGTGLFTAGNLPGSYINTVKATSGTISGTATVNVVGGPVASIIVSPNPATLAQGGLQRFTSVGLDAAGNVVPLTPVWSVVAGGGAIDASTGVFTAGNTPGTFTNTVKATQGTISGNATVIVTAGPVTTITVTPNPATLAPGAQQQFTAVAVDATGRVVAITPVWSVVAGGGSINASTGVFTAGATAGTFPNTVMATSGTASGTATVIVTASAAPLATITVTPNPATVQTNGTQTFVAVGRDAAGVVVPITPVWSVTNGGGNINSGTGVFTAGAVAGTFNNTVRATSGTIFGTATVIVTAVAPPPPPAPIVNLGAAALNGIMAGTTITCVTGGIINADIAISPGSTVTGFGPCVVTGSQHLADALAAQAQIDLTAAYNTLAGLPCPPANVVGTTNIGGTTKAAGVYCSPSSMQVTGTLTLDGGGDANAVFVFQAGSTLTTAGSVVLINGAQAKNVYFVVGSSATLGVGSAWQGNIIALSSITLNNNVTLLGRALARNGAVTLGNGNIITLP